MPLTPEQVVAKAAALKTRHAKRDARYADVSAVRRGDYEEASPGMFPSDLPKEIVANAVEAYARDMAESLAGLPSFNCSSANMKSDKARTRADKRTKIVSSYLLHSKLGKQMLAGADHYSTFAFVSAYVEPDYAAKMPRITIETSVGSYPEFNRWGEVISEARYYRKTVGQLVSEWPDFENQIRGGGDNPLTRREDTAMMEMVRYVDADQTLLFLPAAGDRQKAVVLAQARNKTGKCPVKVAVRPQWDDEMRGQFDSVIWVQIARARMAQLSWEAAEKSVQAPIVATPDMQEFAFGPDSILYTQNPEKVRRLPIEIPQSAFAEMANLGNEMRLGARYPEGRTGNLSASVVTGRGVQELNAGFNTSIQAGQAVFAPWLTEIVEQCFLTDEAYWPNYEKTIRGTQNDAPFEVKYVPSRDIAGDYTVDVQYGLAAGLDPNRATVLLLQLRGDEAISRDFMLRQMPFNINVTDEIQRIQVEKTRDAIMTSIQGLAASMPQMAQMGQDPVELAQKLADLVAELQKGTQLEDAYLKAFQPPKPPPAPEGAAEPGAEPSLPGAEPAPAAPATGGLPGAGGAPQGPPDLATALATLTSGGQASMRVGTQRRHPI